MFHQTSTKLTAFYLGILMFISLVFSGALYQVSINELRRSVDRPLAVSVRAFDVDAINQLHEQIREDRLTQYTEAKRRLIGSLIAANILILLGGGFLSYYLARRTLQPIEEAHKSLERFTSDASHELRTPLAVMRTENEIALMDPKLTVKTAKEQLTSNLEEVDKLTTLTEGLLRLSRHKGQSLHRDQVDFITVVSQAIDRVSKQAEIKKVTIRNKANEFKGGAGVVGDEAGLIEAVVVLLDNAVKYSPSKSEVVVNLQSVNHHLKLTVADSGPGISKADQPHIFERFYRADNSRSDGAHQGYGLGLAIAQNIVESHDGTISFKTSKKGSTFIVTLPRHSS